MDMIDINHKYLGRIEEAREDSQISIFYDKDKCISRDGFRAVFENTVMTQRWKKAGNPRHLGDFYKGSHTDQEIIAILGGVDV